MKKRSVKIDRINADVFRVLSGIIRNEVKDPRVGMMTSITAVDVAKDLKSAKIFVSVLGEPETLDSTIEGLKSSAGFIRSRLAKELNLRNTPELRFMADASISYGMKMSQMIDEVIKKDEKGEEENGTDDGSDF